MNQQLSMQAFRRNLDKVAKAYLLTPEYLERLIGSVVVVELLKTATGVNSNSHYVKGGTGAQLRLGLSIGRSTSDLDMSTALARGAAEKLILGLENTSWSSFRAARVKRLRDKTQFKVPSNYRLLEFQIQLLYGNSQWITVTLELSQEEFEHPEILTEAEINHGIVELFVELGLEVPHPVRLIPVELQIAQKLHACTEPGSERGHDIYDIAMLQTMREIDWVLLATLTKRTFTYRKLHQWSVDFTPSGKFKDVYLAETDDIAGAPGYEEALRIVQSMIRRIDEIPLPC